MTKLFLKNIRKLNNNYKITCNKQVIFFIYFTGDNMDKESLITSFNHNITLSERKNIVITGLKKIESFDKLEFNMETTLGNLVIKGSELEIVKLDTYQGNITIKGKVNSLTYNDEKPKSKEDGFLGKLFK